MSDYLIPANSKKSMLILGFFRPLDLLVFGTGCLVTIILLFTGTTSNLGVLIGIMTPALISGFLVLPIPNYHNMMHFIFSIYSYFSNRRRYIWKGWCASDVKD